MPRSTRSLRPAAVLLVALSAVALTGCDPQETGAAAVVGDIRISQGQVDVAVRETAETAGTVNEDAAPATVTYLVRQALLDEAAAREGIVVTDGQVDELIQSSITDGNIDELYKSAAQQAGRPPDGLEDYAREVLIEQELAAKLGDGDPSSDASANAVRSYIRQLSEELGVSVAARYGVWEPGTLTVELANCSTSSLAPPSDVDDIATATLCHQPTL